MTISTVILYDYRSYKKILNLLVDKDYTITLGYN